mgnify:CR=1 FL=1
MTSPTSAEMTAWRLSFELFSVEDSTWRSGISYLSMVATRASGGGIREETKANGNGELGTPRGLSH